MNFILEEFLTRRPWHKITLLQLANQMKRNINQPGKLDTMTGQATWYMYVYVWEAHCPEKLSFRISWEPDTKCKTMYIVRDFNFYSGSTLSLLILRCICDGCHLDRPQRLKRGPPELKAWVSTAKEPGSETGCKRLFMSFRGLAAERESSYGEMDPFPLAKVSLDLSLYWANQEYLCSLALQLLSSCSRIGRTASDCYFSAWDRIATIHPIHKPRCIVFNTDRVFF